MKRIKPKVGTFERSTQTIKTFVDENRSKNVGILFQMKSYTMSLYEIEGVILNRQEVKKFWKFMKSLGLKYPENHECNKENK